MNIDLKNLPTLLAPLLAFMRKYLVFGLFLTVSGSLAFLLFQVNQLTAQQPDDDAVLEKLQTVPRPRIDQATIDRIKQLEDQNVQVQSLFEDARNNPFNE